jgi:site-specific DNA recombinase
LLSGLVYCARCGSPLYGHISPQRGKFDPARAYRCTRATRTRECDLPRIPAHALEHAILDELASLAHQPEYIEKMREIAAKRTAAAAQKTDTQRATLRAELKSMRAKLTNVANAIENGGHSATLLKRLNELETQQTRLQNQLNLLQTKPDELPPAESAQIQRVFAQAANIIQNASVADGQTILRGMVEKIATDRSEKHLTIDIELRLPKKKVM